MAATLEYMKRQAGLIRDEYRKGANTAHRVGSLFYDLCERLALVVDEILKLDDKYLHKDKPDSTKFLIQFLGGLEAGLYAAGGISGNKLHPDGLAELGRLQVNGHSEFRGNLSSKEFISGFMTGKGWAIQLKKYLNSAGVEETRAVGELDDLIVRGTLRVFEFVVSQMLGENDNRVFTAMLEVDHYDPETGKVWLNTQNGRLYNPFRVDDCIVVQQYNGIPSEDNDYYITKQYELIITEVGVGDMSLGVDRLDWVTFKNFTTNMVGGDVSLITKGDTFVRWDNLSDPTRKGIIQMMTVGESTPYMDIAYGLKTNPDNALKGRIGNLEGIYHHLFGWLQSFGAYLINLYAVGDFRLRQTGESLDTKIEMTRSVFLSRFQKLSYELTEEDNYLTNATFTENMEGWIRENDIDFITVNDEALLLNRSVVTARKRVADIQEYEGRNMLCISNSFIRQSNHNIRKPDKHKEYKKQEGEVLTEEFVEVADTLYLSLKLLCKKSGILTIGFEGSSVSEDTLPYTSFNVTSSTDWQTYQWSGQWDGVGDFVLAFTGDMFVSLLSITDNPLSDYKKEVSTSIEQTYSNIRLLGQNINNLEGTVTNLGIDLDAAEERISIYADKVDTLEGTVTNLGIRLDAAEGDISIYAEKHDSLQGVVTELGIRLDTAESSIELNAERIDEVNDSVTNLGIRLDAAEGDISIYAEKHDSLQGVVTELGIRLDTAESSIELNAGRIDEVNESVTNLGIRLDAAEGDISIYAKKVDANTTSIAELVVTTESISTSVTSVEDDLDAAEERIEVVAAIAESAGDAEVYKQSSNPWNSWPFGYEYKHVGAVWRCTYTSGDFVNGHTYRYIGYDNANSWEDITNIQSSTSYVLQNQSKISAVVSSFDSDGNLTNTSGLVTTSYASSMFATKSTVDTLSGRITTAEASIDVHSTQISLKVSKDGVISAINQSSESVTIDASKINLNGYTNVNDTLSIDESGHVIVSGILKGDFECVYAYKMNHINYDGYWYICNSFSSLHSNNVYLSRNTDQDHEPITNETTGLIIPCQPSYCHLPPTAYGAEFFVYNANNYASVYLSGVIVLSGSNVVSPKSAVRCKCVGYGNITLGYIFERVVALNSL